MSSVGRPAPVPLGRIGRHFRAVQTLFELKYSASLRRTPPAELGSWLAGRFHELGPTFVKVGQFISSRRDVFGDDFSKEFAHMRDSVPPIPTDIVREILARHLREGIVESVDENPIASASIGQVHAVRLRGGMSAIVKVKRPGVERIMREDISFLRTLTAAALTFGVDRNLQQVQDGLRDFEAYLTQEVDFRREAANVERFRLQYQHSNEVVIPRLFASMSDDDVIVMEYVNSTGVLQCVVADATPPQRRAAANRLMDVFVSQLVHDGLLHGDPHPGNVGRDARGRLVIYDFGNVIEVTTEERMRLKELICQLLIGNNAGVVETLRKLGVGIDDPVALYKYIDLYRDYMRTIDVRAISLQHDPDSKLPLRLTDKIFRIIRAYGILEGVCKQISDEFNYYDLLDNYVDDLVFDTDFLSFKANEDWAAIVARIGDVVVPPPPAALPPPPAVRAPEPGVPAALHVAALWAVLLKLAFFS